MIIPDRWEPSGRGARPPGRVRERAGHVLVGAVAHADAEGAVLGPHVAEVGQDRLDSVPGDQRVQPGLADHPAVPFGARLRSFDDPAPLAPADVHQAVSGGALMVGRGSR